MILAAVMFLILSHCSFSSLYSIFAGSVSLLIHPAARVLLEGTCKPGKPLPALEPCMGIHWLLGGCWEAGLRTKGLGQPRFGSLADSGLPHVSMYLTHITPEYILLFRTWLSGNTRVIENTLH